MRTEYLQDFKEQYLKDSKTIIYTISALLVVALGIVLFATIDRFDLGWIKFVVSFLFALALLMLNARWPAMARLFQRLKLNLLFPAIDELIANQERCEQNHAVIKLMAHTLSFYNLWPQLDLEKCRPPQKPQKRTRLARFWQTIRHRFRGTKRAATEPNFHEDLFKSLPLVDDEAERITNCCVKIAECRYPSSTVITADLLNILYRERAGLNIPPPGNEMLAKKLRHDLAQVLIDSGRLKKELICREEVRVGTAVGAPTFACGFQGKIEDLLPPLDAYRFRLVEKRLRELRQANHLVVKTMQSVLGYYGIVNLGIQFCELLTNSIPADDYEGARIANCTRNVAACLLNTDTPYPASLLELLYRDRNQLPAYHITLDKKLIRSLAVVLVESKRLPVEKGLPYEAKDIELILQNPADFSLDRVIEQLMAYQTNRREDRAVIENMLRALVYYDLIKLLAASLVKDIDEHGVVSLIEPFEEKLRGALFPASTLDERISACAAALIPLLESSPVQLSGPVLELLYRERQALERVALQPAVIPELAGVLVHSGRLPEQDEELPPYTAQNIERLLAKLPEFTLGGAVDALNLYQTRRRENRIVVTGMERALVFYKIFPFLETAVYQQTNEGRFEFTETFRASLINALPKSHKEEALIKNCAHNIAEKRLGRTSPVSGELLELLYREHHEMESAEIWEQGSDELVRALATVLLGSDRLPDDKEGFLCEQEDLERLLRPLRNFSLSLVRALLTRLGDVWRLATGYHTFLEQNGVSGWLLQEDALLTFIENQPTGLPEDEETLTRLEAVTLDILFWIGHMTIAAARSNLSPPLVYSFCLISLAINVAKFERKYTELLAEVCRLAAEVDEAVLIALAYLEFRADMESGVTELDGRRFVSVDYLINHWEQRIAEKRQELDGFDKEVATVKQALAEGEWLTRLWQLLEQTWRQLREENKNLHDLVKQNKAARQAVEHAIEIEVSPETLERFLEARTVNAYLLAFEARRGRLGKLIDCLSLQPLEAIVARPGDRQMTKSQKEQLRQKLRIMEAHGIALKDEQSGHWIYHFAHYTDHTRIGIAPYGWTLEKFFRVLDRDLRELTDNTTLEEKQLLVPEHEWVEDLDRTEVILHRFGLRNHHVIPLLRRSKTAVDNMKQLFARYLKDHDLVSIINYGRHERVRAVDAMMAGSIVDFARETFDFGVWERSQLERQDEIVKQRLLEQLPYVTIQELGRAIVKNGGLRGQVETALTQLLITHVEQLQNEPMRAGQIAHAYFDTLTKIARVNHAKPSENGQGS